jgi:hypothetical protein
VATSIMIDGSKDWLKEEFVCSPLAPRRSRTRSGSTPVASFPSHNHAYPMTPVDAGQLLKYTLSKI